MNKENLISLLRKKGLKVTPQRLAICEEVLSREDHPTAEQIYKEILKKHPAISLTTVYHTLEILQNLGLVQELQLKSYGSRYDPNTSVHVNIICTKCDRIQDYESDSVRKKWGSIISEIGADAIGQRLDVYIICEECTKAD